MKKWWNSLSIDTQTILGESVTLLLIAGAWLFVYFFWLV